MTEIVSCVFEMNFHHQSETKITCFFPLKSRQLIASSPSMTMTTQNLLVVCKICLQNSSFVTSVKKCQRKFNFNGFTLAEDIFLVVESFLDLTLSCRLTAIFDQLSFVHSLYQHGKIFWPYKKNNAVIKHDRAEVQETPDNGYGQKKCQYAFHWFVQMYHFTIFCLIDLLY